MHFWLRRGTLIICALLLSVAMPILSADAATKYPPKPNPAAKVKMKSTCTNVAPEALKYAKEHGIALCEGVRPDNEIGGDCGTSTLYIYNLGGGNALFYTEAYSLVGSITLLYYNVGWANQTRAVGDTFLGFAAPGSNFWSKGSVYTTLPGHVVGTMTGWALIGTNYCYFLNPSDQEDVT